MPDETAETKDGEATELRRKRSAAGRIVVSGLRRVSSIAGIAAPAVRGCRWVVAAVVVGGLPFVLSVFTGFGGHQLVSAIGLSLLCLALAKDDAGAKGIATIALTFLTHCIVVIALARQMPDTVGPLLPGAEEYWQKQVVWIETGQDPEYEPSAWVPAHFVILMGTALYSFTSFGALAFYSGFQQVDMMNFYNARLMAQSISEPMALGFGWHLWSILRGLG